MSDLCETKAAMGAAFDWLGVGEPHGRTPARLEARRLAARAVMGAPIRRPDIASARRVLRAAPGEMDRVDLATMIDLSVYLMENEQR